MNIDQSIYIPDEEHHSKGQPCEDGTYVYLEDDLYVCNKCGKLFKFYDEVRLMTIQEQIEKLKQDIKNTNELLNTQLAALEEQLKAQQQSKVQVPKMGEAYFTISWGRTEAFEAHWDNTIFDRNALKMGNAFQTKEECEWEIQHRIVTTELKHFVTENDPRPITEKDWENEMVAKYYIVYDNVADVVRIYATGSYRIADQVYSSNMETFDKAIARIGEERLKRYYFGVEVE